MQPNRWRAEDWKPAGKIERHISFLFKGRLPPFFLRLFVVFLRHRAIRTCGGQARADILNSLNRAAKIGHASWDRRLKQARQRLTGKL